MHMEQAKVWIQEMIKEMMNVDEVIKEETKEYNPNWPETPDHSYRILIVAGSGSGKKKLYLI